MKQVLILIVILCVLSLMGCENQGSPSAFPFGGDMDNAENALVSFFDALSQQDFRVAAQYHLAPNPLIYLYKDIDEEDAEALLRRACVENDLSWCKFYCWKIKDVVSGLEISPDEYVFKVRFEDEKGNILTGGDNVTPRPCLPPDCNNDEYTYLVKRIDGNFYVDGIPVFLGCWP